MALQANALKAEGQPVATVFPKEGLPVGLTPPCYIAKRNIRFALQMDELVINPKSAGRCGGLVGSLPVVPQGCKASPLLGEKGVKQTVLTISIKSPSGKRL